MEGMISVEAVRTKRHLSLSCLFQNGYHMSLSFRIVLSLRHVAIFCRQDKTCRPIFPGEHFLSCLHLKDMLAMMQ